MIMSFTRSCSAHQVIESGTGRAFWHLQDVNVYRILFRNPGKQRRDVKPRCKLKGNIIKGGVSGPDHRVDGPEVPSETYIYAYSPCIHQCVPRQ